MEDRSAPGQLQERIKIGYAVRSACGKALKISTTTSGGDLLVPWSSFLSFSPPQGPLDPCLPHQERGPGITKAGTVPRYPEGTLDGFLTTFHEANTMVKEKMAELKIKVPECWLNFIDEYCQVTGRDRDEELWGMVRGTIECAMIEDAAPPKKGPDTSD